MKLGGSGRIAVAQTIYDAIVNRAESYDCKQRRLRQASANKIKDNLREQGRLAE